jgi:hypothetical protein
LRPQKFALFSGPLKVLRFDALVTATGVARQQLNRCSSRLDSLQRWASECSDASPREVSMRHTFNHSLAARSAQVSFALAALAMAACDKTPTGLKNDPFANFNPQALASSESSIPHGVTDAGKVVPLFLIPGMPDLSQACASGGTTVTGIAFDGTNIYVGHGGFVNSCITRYTNAGVYIDQKIFGPDTRGLTWVPGLGKLVARTFGGSLGNQDNPAEIGRFFTIDYPAGTSALLTNYDVQTSNPQGQPGVDPDGAGYWITKAGNLEHHRMSDGLLLASVAASQFFTGTDPVTAAAGVVGIPISPNTYDGYDRSTLAFLGTFAAVSSNGCSGYGVGVSNDLSRLGINLNCSVVTIEATTLTHAVTTPYPSAVYPGHVILCKDSRSPAGTYIFTGTATGGIVAGDVTPAVASLSPGQCKVVFLRTTHSATIASLTITESPVAGTVVSTITRTQLGATTVSSGPSPTIDVSVNSSQGAVVTYYNVAAPPP